MTELTEKFGLTRDDLDIDLGPLGPLLGGQRERRQLASGRQPFVVISLGQPHIPQCHMWHFVQAIRLCMTP